MSAPRCTVCNGTGSMSCWTGGDLDCTACDTAAGRAALNAQIEAATREAAEEYRLAAFDPVWLAYQLGKAAAPVAAQPSKVQPAPELREVLRDSLASSLTGYMRECDLYPAADCIDLLDELCDLAIAVLSPVAAVSAAPSGEVERAAIMEEAAKLCDFQATWAKGEADDEQNSVRYRHENRERQTAAELCATSIRARN